MSAINTKITNYQPKNSFEYITLQFMQLAQQYIDANYKPLDDYLVTKYGITLEERIEVLAKRKATRSPNSGNRSGEHAAEAGITTYFGTAYNVAKWTIKEAWGSDDSDAKVTRIDALMTLISKMHEDMQLSPMIANKTVVAKDEIDDELDEKSKTASNVPLVISVTAVTTVPAVATTADVNLNLNKNNAVQIQGRIALHKTHVSTARALIQPATSLVVTSETEALKSAAVLDNIDAALEWLEKVPTLNTFEPVLAHELEVNNLVKGDLASEISNLEIELLSYLFRLLFDIKFDEIQALKTAITGYKRKIPSAISKKLTSELATNIASLEAIRTNSSDLRVRIQQVKLIVNEMLPLAIRVRDDHAQFSFKESILSFYSNDAYPTYNFFNAVQAKFQALNTRVLELSDERQLAQVAERQNRVRVKLNVSTKPMGNKVSLASS